MGCPGKAKLPPNGTIVPLTIKKVVNNGPRKKTQIPRADYHCPRCGYTGPHSNHTCAGERLVGYQEHRRIQCSLCRYAEDNICTLYKSMHPDRDAKIDVGCAMPEAHCPAGAWQRVLYKCEKCNSVTFDENGASHCKVCKHGAPRKITMTFKAEDFRESPLPATRDLAVITLAAGQKALDELELTGPRMAAYADRVGADFHAITDNRYPQYPLANKFRLKNLMSNYKRVLFLDVDVWVRKDADNLFDVVAPGYVGIHVDLPFLASRDWLPEEAAHEAREQQVTPINLQMLNTGVVVFEPGIHAKMWSPPRLPAKPRHLTEQTHVEYNIRNMLIRTSRLQVKYNTQWWMSQFKELEPSAHFVHLANCPHEERMYRFKRYLLKERNETVV
jgi:hypothetical protein